MNVHEYLKFVGQARGLSGNRLAQRLDWCVEACGLVTEYKKSIGELSKGFKQRTGLAQALIHDPDILILDEPTSGLDPLQIIGIRELIKSLAGQKTIIFSTHILQEVRPVTDRVVIINEGCLIADGNINDITRQAMVTNRVFFGVLQDAAVVESALTSLAGVTSAKPLPVESGSRFEVRSEFGGNLVGDLAQLALQNGWDLQELNEAPYSLEDTFISFIQQSQKGVA
jgi:gliding motility-associated transport system ATP-binding protein